MDADRPSVARRAKGCCNMNLVVTDGIDMMPPTFVDGLDDWSSTDGTPGSPNYTGAANAAIVISDPDFGSCLELQTTSDPTS